MSAAKKEKQRKKERKRRKRRMKRKSTLCTTRQNEKHSHKKLSINFIWTKGKIVIWYSLFPTCRFLCFHQCNVKVEELVTWEVVFDLPLYLFDGEVKSLDLLLSICLIPSATLTAGFDLIFPQNDMWAFTASSMAKGIFPLLISSLTASEHNPHNHFPSNLAFTSRIYSWVQSSLRPQHSHLTDSTSISSCKDKFFLNSYLPFKEENENLRIMAATGGSFFLFWLDSSAMMTETVLVIYFMLKVVRFLSWDWLFFCFKN